MAAVLQFDSRMKRDRQLPMAEGETAQIIIFNGVRFERLDIEVDFENSLIEASLRSQATS